MIAHRAGALETRSHQLQKFALSSVCPLDASYADAHVPDVDAKVLILDSSHQAIVGDQNKSKYCQP